MGFIKIERVMLGIRSSLTRRGQASMVRLIVNAVAIVIFVQSTTGRFARDNFVPKIIDNKLLIYVIF